MKEVKCGMVEDLFDSYREQLTSDETSAMIKTHLSECAGCRKKYADFSHLREEEENKEKNKEEKFQKKLLTYRRCGIGILIGAIVSVITVVALGIIFLLLVFFGGPPYITKDAAKYEAAMQRYDNIQCGFAVFPDKIAAEAKVEEFYFSYQDTWDDPTCEVFLQCHYPTQVYEKEIQRLEAVERVYGEDKGRSGIVRVFHLFGQPGIRCRRIALTFRFTCIRKV